MKSIIFKNVYIGFIVFFLNACHTFEHQNIFVENFTKNSNEELSENKNKNSKIHVNKTNNIELAPIDLPKQKAKVQKFILKKQVKIENINNFNLNQLNNLGEFKLIKKLGKSNFIKEEGRLKNHQYHFKECFLDVFLIKKNNEYLVSYVETRPTKLNGNINTRACHEKIYKTLK